MRTHRPAIVVVLAVLSAGVASGAGNRAEFGAEERVRSESWNEITDQDEALPDQRIQYRFRTRVWLKYQIDDRWEFAAGLNNESRDIVRPETEFAWDEVIFETLYAGWRAGDRFSARVGRQNLMRGEGFVLFDGNALDGSRTAYFNAALLAWTWPAAKLELMAISNPRQDQYLPRVGDKKRALTEWDEAALGAYATGKLSDATAVEGYWIYKTETDDPRPATDPLFQPDRSLHTLGGRIVRGFGAGWNATAEFALQRGTQDPRPGDESAGEADLGAWGGSASVKKTFGGSARPALSIGYIGLSGDDPGTRDVEGWDPLFSRWPKWSELYIYTLAPERGPAYWSNLGMWQAELLVTPVEPLALRATWYRMDAYERATGARFGGGTRRGDLWQVRADVTVGRNWKGHALYEHFDPGDFYAGDDAGYFLRFEVIYTLKLPAVAPAERHL